LIVAVVKDFTDKTTRLRTACYPDRGQFPAIETPKPDLPSSLLLCALLLFSILQSV